VRLLVVITALACLFSSSSRAGAMALSERDFWSRLQQTDRLLEQAAAPSLSQRDTILDEIRGLWASVDAVHLADGRVVAVDMRWLGVGLTATNIEERQRWVKALLAYHAQPGQAASDNSDSLATLDHILKDPRFRYPEITPTTPPPEPTPQPQRSTRSGDLIPAGLAQAVLVVIGIIGVIAVLLYIGRTLQVQRAAIVPIETDGDPTTSEAADTLAAQSEAAQDYRQAIRYLYLSSLLMLDERGLIHYDRTLTNREHLRLIVDNPVLLEALRPVVNTFDRVWYGFAPVDAQLYQDFSQNVERLRQLEAVRER
jgi:hypothetical protein